jgi:CheY-like chemotaxis protein
VTDNGRGIPPAKQRKLFSAFQQIVALQPGSAQTAALKGTGLGLYIVRQLVRRHGGRVGLSSTGVPGQPTVFWFEVPVRVARVAGAPGAAVAALPLHTQRWVSTGQPFAVGGSQWRGGLAPTESDMVASPTAGPTPAPSRGMSPDSVPQMPPDDMLPGTVEVGDAGALLAGVEPSSTHARLRTDSRMPSDSAGLHSMMRGETTPSQLLGMRSNSADSAAAALTSASVTASTADLPPFGILVVDDSETLRKLLARTLQRRFPQAEVLEAEHGLQAVETWTRLAAAGPGRTPSIITMDHNMEPMAGDEAVRRLRAMGCASLILGVTGNALGGDMASFRSCGVDGVFTKPVRMRDITGIIAAYVRGGRAAAAPLLVAALNGEAGGSGGVGGGGGGDARPSTPLAGGGDRDARWERSTAGGERDHSPSGSSASSLGGTRGVRTPLPAMVRHTAGGAVLGDGSSGGGGGGGGDGGGVSPTISPAGSGPSGVLAGVGLMVRGRSVDRGGPGGVVDRGKRHAGSPLASGGSGSGGMGTSTGTTRVE